MITRIIASGIFALSFAASAMAEKPVLTVYSYDSFASDWGPGPQIATSFEKTCDCTVNFVATADSVAMLSKVILEGKKSKADILVGLDTNLAVRAEKSGLFIKHGLMLPETVSLPIEWDNPYFAPFDWGVLAFMYNSDKMPNPPKSFAELRKLPEDIKIVLQDPRTSTPGYSLVLWLEHLYPNNAEQVWQDIRPNVLTFTKGWWDAYSMFLEGQADMVLSYTTSEAYHKIAEDLHNIKAIEFEEGHIAQIELSGILANSKNVNLAKKFLAHMQSVEVQKIIPTTNWSYPIRSDVEMDKGFHGLVKPKNLFVPDPEDTENHRKERIRRWQQAVR